MPPTQCQPGHRPGEEGSREENNKGHQLDSLIGSIQSITIRYPPSMHQRSIYWRNTIWQISASPDLAQEGHEGMLHFIRNILIRDSQIKPPFLDIAPAGIPPNIMPHSKGVKCGLMRPDSLKFPAFIGQPLYCQA